MIGFCRKIRRILLAHTNINTLRQDAKIETTLLGQYETLKEHIAAHRWYLGESSQKEVTYEEAVSSWYDHVYLPIVEIIREQKILDEFPGRTETDLYLWIIRHQWFLREHYGSEISIEEAAEKFTVPIFPQRVAQIYHLNQKSSAIELTNQTSNEAAIV